LFLRMGRLAKAAMLWAGRRRGKLVGTGRWVPI